MAYVVRDSPNKIKKSAKDLVDIYNQKKGGPYPLWQGDYTTIRRRHPGLQECG